LMEVRLKTLFVCFGADGIRFTQHEGARGPPAMEKNKNQKKKTGVGPFLHL